MAWLPGKFVWFEHVSNDVPKARRFYGELFGWTSDPVPMGGPEPYPLIMNAGAPIGGFRAAEGGMPNHWISYMSVPDVDAAAKAAAAAGARVVMPPTDFAPVGRGAGLADPNGAPFCIWKSSDGDAPDAEKVPAGAWYWNECMGEDEQKALAFYEKAFGYTHDTMDMGPSGKYYLLMHGGVPRGGLMRKPDPAAPTCWTGYVSVSDCDATAKKVEALGGKLMLPPHDIPEVGRITIFTDPLGAMLGAMRGVHTA